MKTRLLNVLIGLFAVAATCFVCAQTEKKPLTNADILQLVKAGLGENVIILSIQGSPANYDTSPTALIEMNKLGVTAKVQEAMLAAQKASQPSAGTSSQTVVPGLPAGGAATTMPNTVVYLDGTNRVEMKRSQGKMETDIIVVVVKMKWVFEGKHAEFRPATNTPTFEVSLLANFYPSDTIILFKPAVKKDHREIFVGGAAPFAQIKPDKKKDTLPLAFEELRKENTPGMQLTVYRVTPTAPLPAGEYALSVFNAFHCFGVDVGK